MNEKAQEREGEYSPRPIRSSGDLLRAAQPAARLIYWFDIPEGIGEKLNIQTLGLQELLTNEEMMATKRAMNDPIRLAFELAKESVRFVNEEPVNTGDGSADIFWAKHGQGMAKLRQLVLTAYAQIHNPENHEVASFLASCRMTVK